MSVVTIYTDHFPVPPFFSLVFFALVTFFSKGFDIKQFPSMQLTILFYCWLLFIYPLCYSIDLILCSLIGSNVVLYFGVLIADFTV